MYLDSYPVLHIIDDFRKFSPYTFMAKYSPTDVWYTYSDSN